MQGQHGLPCSINKALIPRAALPWIPSNPSTVWVGSGEDVGGRHVAYGDGVYRSKDAGTTWENLGLKGTEHIARIVVHPDNSDVVWVAAQGPLWNKGGERGVYKTTDGGMTWNRVLGNDEWTGATDLIIDPRDPRRVVRRYMGSAQNSRCPYGGMARVREFTNPPMGEKPG